MAAAAVIVSVVFVLTAASVLGSDDGSQYTLNHSKLAIKADFVETNKIFSFSVFYVKFWSYWYYWMESIKINLLNEKCVWCNFNNFKRKLVLLWKLEMACEREIHAASF